jgi:biotin operon repressor
VKRYLYRVELLSDPDHEAYVGRLVYMSRSAAQHRVNRLRSDGIDAVIERSNLITWPEVSVL